MNKIILRVNRTLLLLIAAIITLANKKAISAILAKLGFKKLGLFLKLMGKTLYSV